MIRLSNFLNHTSTERFLSPFLRLPREYSANWGLKPLVWHSKLCPLGVLDVSYVEWVRSLRLLFDLLAIFVELNHGLTAAFRGLFLEEAVDGVELGWQVSNCIHKKKAEG